MLQVELVTTRAYEPAPFGRRDNPLAESYLESQLMMHRLIEALPKMVFSCLWKHKFFVEEELVTVDPRVVHHAAKNMPPISLTLTLLHEAHLERDAFAVNETLSRQLHQWLQAESGNSTPPSFTVRLLVVRGSIHVYNDPPASGVLFKTWESDSLTHP